MKPGPKGLRRWLCHAMAATVAICVITPPIILLADRRPVVAVTELHVEPPTLIPGEPAYLRWHGRTLRSECGGIVRRQIIDGAGIIHDFAPVEVVMRSDDGGYYSRGFVVPMNAAPGNGFVRTRAIRWCNVLQENIWPMADPIRTVPVRIATRERG